MGRKIGVGEKAKMGNGPGRANMHPIGASARPENQVGIKERCDAGFQEPDNTRYAGGKVGLTLATLTSPGEP